jgi:hypothetical protein
MGGQTEESGRLKHVVWIKSAGLPRGVFRSRGSLLNTLHTACTSRAFGETGPQISNDIQHMLTLARSVFYSSAITNAASAASNTYAA